MNATIGSEYRARRADNRKFEYYSECTTRPITPEEYKWLESLNKPEGKKPTMYLHEPKPMRIERRKRRKKRLRYELQG